MKVTTNGKQSAAYGIATQEAKTRKYERKVLAKVWLRVVGLALIPFVAYFVLSAWGNNNRGSIERMARSNPYGNIDMSRNGVIGAPTAMPLATPGQSVDIVTAFATARASVMGTYTPEHPRPTAVDYGDVVRIPGGSIISTMTVPTPAMAP